MVSYSVLGKAGAFQPGTIQAGALLVQALGQVAPVFRVAFEIFFDFKGTFKFQVSPYPNVP